MLLQDLIRMNNRFKDALPKDVLLMVEVLEKIQYKNLQIVWDWTPSRVENDRRHEKFEVEFITLKAHEKAIPAYHFALVEKTRPYISKEIPAPFYPSFIVSQGKMHIANLADFLREIYSFVLEAEIAEIEKNFLFNEKPLCRITSTSPMPQPKPQSSNPSA